MLTLLHSERPKLLAVLSAKGLGIFKANSVDPVEMAHHRSKPQILGVSNFCVLGHPDRDSSS